MYCPKCAARVRGIPPRSYCEATRAALPAQLHADLFNTCVVRTEKADAALGFLVGGTWFCPACASRMSERNSQLSCPTCGACLNRLVHDLVEVFVHPSTTERCEGSDIGPLLCAALAGETEVARAIWIHSPQMRSARGAAGESAAELALAAGHSATAVALLRSAGEPLPSTVEPRGLLERMMSEISEAIACAGWLENLEHLLWHVAHSTSVLPENLDPCGFRRLTSSTCEDLRWLARLSGGWYAFTDERPAFFPLPEWSVIHQRWAERWLIQR